jgi:hypothetical protein
MSNTTDYTFKFESTETSNSIFEFLLKPQNWWTGLYSEKIEGNSSQLNDEFTFNAGDGVHYSRQKLIDLIPDKKIVWLVTDSHLSFLEKPTEWIGTKICFEITNKASKTIVQFTHQGLIPKIECYKDCSSAWTRYLENLSEKLNEKEHRD